VPQIFVAGKFVGGATDSFDAWRSGELQQWLRDAGVPFQEPAELNPYTFLSGWMH
jgi:cysteine synthase A